MMLKLMLAMPTAGVQDNGDTPMGSILSSPKAPPMPVAPEPTPMPDPKATGDAKRREIERVRARSGRDSTILTGGDKLGG